MAKEVYNYHIKRVYQKINMIAKEGLQFNNKQSINLQKANNLHLKKFIVWERRMKHFQWLILELL